MDTNSENPLKRQPETEAIDRLFLELSQFTNATTGKENELQRTLSALYAQIGEAREQAMKLCWEIEKLPASALQSEISVKAAALGSSLNELLP